MTNNIITVRIPVEQLFKLDFNVAIGNARTRSDVIRDAIDKYETDLSV